MKYKITPKLAYILGFLWADGYLVHSDKSSKVVGMYLTFDDFIEIENIIISELGIKTFYDRNLKNRKKQRGFTTGKVDVYNFLYDLDYKEKSRISPFKAINFIGDKYFKYWLRGLIDGDGSIFISNKSSQFSITSSYEYDWSLIIDHLKNKVGVSHIGFFKNTSNNGSLSRITIQNIEDISKVFNFVYPSKKHDFGLKRKFHKFVENEYKKSPNYKKNCLIRRNLSVCEYTILRMSDNVMLKFMGRKEMNEYFISISKEIPLRNDKINYQNVLFLDREHKGYMLIKKTNTNKYEKI